jgi:hypothetical protein
MQVFGKRISLSGKRTAAILMLSLGALALVPDTASAQRRGGGGARVGVGPRGGVGVGVGGIGVGVGPRGGVAVGVGRGGYGYGGYGYRNGGWYGRGFWPGVAIGAGVGALGGYGYGGGYSSSPIIITGSSGVAPAAATVPADTSNSDSAMLVTDVNEGGARVAGIQRGDVIISVDGRRTHNFDELHGALANGRNQAAIEFFNPNTSQRSTANVAVVNGTIGVSVVEVPVNFQ